MKVLDLFSGIGGFSLGLERAGMKTVAFCEIDKYCQAVLRKHWSEIPIYDDIKTLSGVRFVGTVDVICGGFPCQDISVAGKGAGLSGERSGLWFEFHRLIAEIRPRYAIIENVSALRSRGLDKVLGSLAEIGYDAEWHCIPASAVGAPHRRDRVWIVAHSQGAERAGIGAIENRSPDGLANGSEDVADAARVQSGRQEQWAERERTGPSGQSIALSVSDALCAGLEGQRSLASRISQELENACNARGWQPEPDVGRVAHGVPARVHRLRSLGNSIVPQIATVIGQAIMNYEAQQ